MIPWCQPTRATGWSRTTRCRSPIVGASRRFVAASAGFFGGGDECRDSRLAISGVAAETSTADANTPRSSSVIVSPLALPDASVVERSLSNADIAQPDLVDFPGIRFIGLASAQSERAIGNPSVPPGIFASSGAFLVEDK